MYEELSRLIAPATAEEFFERFTERRHLCISRDREDFYRDILSIASADVFLQSEHLPAAFVKLVTNGVSHPADEWSAIRTIDREPERVALPERVFDLYTKGATAILNGAHQSLPVLGALCRGLMRELGCAAQANVYITPPESQGFREHVDKHEVLVLQISGSKSWVLRPEGCGPIEIQLRAGDLLYLPSGLAHGAKSAESASIHITVGLFPTYGFQLIEELALIASRQPEFWKPFLPRTAQAANLGPEAEFTRHLQELLAKTSVAQLVERRFNRLVDMQPRGWPGRFHDVLSLPRITPATVVRKRPEVLYLVELDGRSLIARFAGKHVTLPAFLRPSLDRILQDAPFAIGDLPGLITDTGKVDLIRPFVETGLLSIVQL
jgi:ribosomal protein L16 Arg81 hydroxylase